MGNVKRARDVDRDLAIDFVEAAWVDGQLTREEYDVRVDRLLRARTLDELERDLSDLQGPDGAPWRPDGAAVPVSHLARDRAGSVPATPATTPDGTGLRAGGPLFAALLGCLAVVGFFVVIADTPDAPTGLGDVVTIDSSSPQSARGYRELVSALDREVGDTAAFALVLEEKKAYGLFPTGPTGIAAQARDWNGSQWSEPKQNASQAERFNLAMITPETIEDAHLAASVVLGPEAVVVLTLGVEEVDGQRSCLRADSTLADGERNTTHYDCQGREIEPADEDRE